jgi:exodeoxyribonuclease-3
VQEVIYSGQRSYNGVALLSVETAQDVIKGLPNFPDEHKRLIAATISGVRIVNVYVPNGQSVGSEKFAYKLEWLAALKRFLQDELEKHPHLVVVGDFNIAPEDRDVHDPKAWEGSVHVSEQERAALRDILSLGLTDVFRKFEQPEKSYTWWDYRMLAWRRNHGLRIDLVLTSPAMTEHCDACKIDREPRGAERPSDHVPVTASIRTDAQEFVETRHSPRY